MRKRMMYVLPGAVMAAIAAVVGVIFVSTATAEVMWQENVLGVPPKGKRPGAAAAQAAAAPFTLACRGKTNGRYPYEFYVTILADQSRIFFWQGIHDQTQIWAQKVSITDGNVSFNVSDSTRVWINRYSGYFSVEIRLTKSPISGDGTCMRTGLRRPPRRQF